MRPWLYSLNIRMVEQRAQGGYGRAFSLVELLVVIAVISLLLGILLPTIGSARHRARATWCMSNLRQQAFADGLYGQSNKELVSGFSWRRDVSYAVSADINNAWDDGTAHRNQAVNVIRRYFVADQQPISSTHLSVDEWYWSLPLLDGGYCAAPLLAQVTTCPEDALAVVSRAYLGRGVPPSVAGVHCLLTLDELTMLPVHSSYVRVPSGWSQDEQGRFSVYQYYPDYRYIWYSNATRLGQRRVDEASFPAQKVSLFDFFDRHTGSRAKFYAQVDSAEPLLFFDGSVSSRRTRDANVGWSPLQPDANVPSRCLYRPEFAFDAPAHDAANGDNLAGYYRWTRHGLKGVDFGGAEVWQ